MSRRSADELRQAGGVWTEELETREEIAFKRVRGAERSEAK
jgi:hypothetical protein